MKPFIVAVALLFTVPWASATTLTHWGTLTAVANSDCGGACDFLTVISALGSPSAQFDVDGAANQLSASASLTTALGSAEANAMVVGGLSMPHLEVAASASGSGFSSAVASAIQGYDYTGGGETITIDVNLTGTVSNSGGIQTELGAFVYLFTTAQLTGFLEEPGTAFAAFALFDALSSTPNSAELPDNPPLDQPNPFAARVSGPVNLDGSLSIDVADGSVTAQQFYLAAFLYGFADGDGNQVDALNSLDLNFAVGTNTNVLTAAGAVPLPATLWLLGPLGAWMLGRGARRHG